MASLLLGRDIGTTATKAILVGPEGWVEAEASSPSRLLSPHPGWAAESPEALVPGDPGIYSDWFRSPRGGIAGTGSRATAGACYQRGITLAGVEADSRRRSRVTLGADLSASWLITRRRVRGRYGARNVQEVG